MAIDEFGFDFTSPNQPLDFNFQDFSGLTDSWGSSPGFLSNVFSSIAESPSGINTADPNLVMVTDTSVPEGSPGRTISLAQAMSIAPEAAQELISKTPELSAFATGASGPGFGPNLDTPLGSSTTQGSGSGGVLDWIKAQNPLVLAGLGLTGVAGIGGLIGVIQKAAQGDQVARTEVQRLIASPNPEERQAVTEAVKAIQGANQFALGSPTSLMSQLGGRVPVEESAFGGAAQRLDQRGSLQDALQRALGGPTSTGAANILGGQESVLNSLNTTAADLARGKLNISPELATTIEQAFQPKMGDLATQLINAARERGFAGGADLLLQAPASQLGQTALRDLQGQMAAAKLEAALKFPQTAAELANASNTPAAIRMQGATQLAGLDQNLIAALGGLGQQGMANRLDFLRALSAPATASSGLASNLAYTRALGSGQTTTASQPTTLLDAFAPLGGFLGGIGGALGGIAALSGNPRSGLSGAV